MGRRPYTLRVPIEIDPEPIIGRLRTAGCVFAEEEAAVLIGSATTVAELDELVLQREAGLPLEHVVGWAEFHGRRVSVDIGVFVPRRRSELLADQAIAIVRPGDIVVDLCCGSGAVGLVVATAVDDVVLHAVDVEPAAVRCARRNLEPIGATAHLGDLYEPLPERLRGRVDVIVANAPYVPTDALELMPREARLHEPLVTLDGGSDGLDIQRRVAESAGLWLVPGGRLLIETSEEQSADTAALMSGAGLRSTIVTSDELDATVVVGVRDPGAMRATDTR
ncbi:MAG: HemK family modification methylase [Ilumatobacteraceae bacterium]|nr:HemK family modification methylase [Ilumatobacteraceae bacterium]